MVDRTLQPSRFQEMFPGKADPNDFLTPFDPGAAGIGTLWASSVGGKMAKEGAHSIAESAKFVNDAVHGNISPWAVDPETGETVPNPAYTAGSMETALNVAAPSFTRSVLGTKGVADPTTLGIFASTGAKTANMDALFEAKRMMAKGASREEVFDATGWFAGADGVWRFEIPDSAAKLKGSLTPGETKLGEILDHPELFAAYPEMADIAVKNEKMAKRLAGYFDRDEKVLGLNTQGKGKDKLDTILHEGQHYVQDKEGMVPGSSNAVSSPYRREVYEDLMNARGPRKEGIAGWWEDLWNPRPTMQELWQEANMRAYRSNHGEVEARNVERRAREGYNKRPWETIDMPAEKVIVDEDKAYRDLLKRKGKQTAESTEANDPWANVGWGDTVEGVPTFGYSKGGFVSPLDQYLDALGTIESGNNYSALGPETESGDRAYGRYQVMGANIPSWTKEALGQSLTPEQFLADKDAQNAVARHRFGMYVDKYGNPFDAASMWFSGRPMARAGQSADITGTSVPEYVGRFANALGQPIESDRSGIASIDRDLLELRRQRLAMGREPERDSRDRMISALYDYYQSSQPKKVSMLMPPRQRG